MRYSKLSRTSLQGSSSKLRFGLVKDQESSELTFSDEMEAHSCFIEMRNFCVLTDFHQNYEITDIIEEGKNSCVIYFLFPLNNTAFLDLFDQNKD